ncbi:MAG: SRPBCC domain-containing protein [Acidobacteriota bacterium]|nr:SRPBCC domain-containing protein [Acidobacteriota bacterium]
MPRQHTHEEIFPISAERLFALLHTPSAIRGWWGAARVIVVPEEGGLWAAAWGEDEDAPDYITVSTLQSFDPPRKMTLGDYRYVSNDGPLPFEADFVTTFEVEPVDDESARLRVIQDGFPDAAEADDFYAACESGWRDTFAGIRRFLDG